MASIAPVSDYAVRPALMDDVPAIFTLLESYASTGNLLPRPRVELERRIRDFFVIGPLGNPIACGALEIFTAELAEIRSLMVAPGHLRRGLGSILVRQLTDEARQRTISRLMALTYAPIFFHGLGFHTVAKETLPEKVWGVCVECYKFNRCDEIAVLKNL
jgi:amino-acid N-acetyltransferase